MGYKVLIAGANSYIGTSVEHYLRRWPEKYSVTTLDMENSSWREHSFSKYDVVYHVAGIAHSDGGRISEERVKLYYTVNCDLAAECAERAKAAGVKQFIFMSSSIVYGGVAGLGQQLTITPDTAVNPENYYGDSKLRAEKAINALADERFKVVILRPPMIYGQGCRGNYPVLAKIAGRLRLFPQVENQRSMLYIGNLVEFVRLMIENRESGLFWPQNPEYTNTSDMVHSIAAANGKKIYLMRGWTWLLKALSGFTPLVNKAFGNFCYDQSMSSYKEPYQLFGLEESIRLTEQK